MEVVLPLALPLAGGVLGLLARRHSGAIVAAACLTSLGASLVLLGEVLGGEIVVYSMGGWPAPFGIVFVADALSSILAVLSTLVFSAAVVSGLGNEWPFHPLMAFTLVGVNGAFLTGDLFNLFVWFEVMLISSYVLVAFEGGWGSVASFRYLAMNLLGSSVMLLGIGAVYRLTGTLNMAHISMVASGMEPMALLPPALLLFLAFGLKAGVFPFHFWVPEVYDSAPPAAAAVLSGVVKKAGVYGLIRLSFFVLPPAAGYLLPLSLALGTASMFYGGFVALGQGNLDRLLAYSSIAQVGIMFFAIGLGGPLGLAAALVTVLAHGLAKPLLFLVSGELERTFASSELSAMGGAASSNFLSASFLVGALSLVGVPPLLGFFAKLLVFQASSAPVPLLGVVVFGSVLTVLYVSMAWTESFWGEPGTGAVPGEPVDFEIPGPAVAASLVTLVAAVLILGADFAPVNAAVQGAVALSLEPSRYVAAVLGVVP